MKIITTKYGITHAYAQCVDCYWDSTIETNDPNRMQKLRNRIYSHIKETGHTVNLETGTSTNYSGKK